MIYVTAGTDKAFGFLRLIQKCDELAGQTSEPFILQIAATPYAPRHATYFNYVEYPRHVEYFKAARLIISHCSIGPILNARKFQKPLIVVPRRGLYKELADEHQMDFARRIESQKLHDIRSVYEVDQLQQAILDFQNFSPTPQEQENSQKLIATLRNLITSFKIHKII